MIDRDRPGAVEGGGMQGVMGDPVDALRVLTIIDDAFVTFFGGIRLGA